jgi:hypothetical protein
MDPLVGTIIGAGLILYIAYKLLKRAAGRQADLVKQRDRADAEARRIAAAIRSDPNFEPATYPARQGKRK